MGSFSWLVLVVSVMFCWVSGRLMNCCSSVFMESFGEGARYHGGGAGQYAALVVAVAGEVVWRDIEELVVETDRGEYVQRVRVRGPANVCEGISVGESVDVAGRVEEHEDGGHVVHHEVDRGWWGNLRENLPGGVLTL